MAESSPELTLGWWATDCICRNVCCPAGVLKGCQRDGSAGLFFLKRSSAAKGMVCMRIEAKRSLCYPVRPQQSMLSPLSFLPRHPNFPSPSLFLLIISHQIPYFSSLISSSIFLQVGKLKHTQLIWIRSITQLAKTDFFRCLIDMHFVWGEECEAFCYTAVLPVNFPVPSPSFCIRSAARHRIRYRYFCHER